MKYLFIALLTFLSSCSRPVYISEPNTLTVGVVQKEIYIGMPGSDVAAILGSPNVVSLDEKKDEVWIYDKVSSQVEHSSKGSGIWLLVIGGGSESSYTKKSQRTLTIIIKLDSNKQVKDFTYHSSNF